MHYTAALRLEKKPRTKQEIATILQISYATLRRRLQGHDIRLSRRLLSLAEQEMILLIFDLQVMWCPLPIELD